MLFKVKLILLSLMVGVVLPSVIALQQDQGSPGRHWQDHRRDSPDVWVYLTPTVHSEPRCIFNIYILYVYMYLYIKKIDRQTGRQVGRQIARQTDRQIDRYYKYSNVWERYVKKKKVSETQMALGINHFMCRKERGLSSPRTRQRSPASVSGRLHPAAMPCCSCFPQI